MLWTETKTNTKYITFVWLVVCVKISTQKLYNINTDIERNQPLIINMEKTKTLYYIRIHIHTYIYSLFFSLTHTLILSLSLSLFASITDFYTIQAVKNERYTQYREFGLPEVIAQIDHVNVCRLVTHRFWQSL